MVIVDAVIIGLMTAAMWFIACSTLGFLAVFTMMGAVGIGYLAARHYEACGVDDQGRRRLWRR